MGNLLFHTCTYFGLFDADVSNRIYYYNMANGISSRSISSNSCPLSTSLVKGGERSDWPVISLIQGVIAVGLVLLFILGLSKLKGFYAVRKLHL